jgi:hypothetical protein
LGMVQDQHRFYQHCLNKSSNLIKVGRNENYILGMSSRV